MSKRDQIANNEFRDVGMYNYITTIMEENITGKQNNLNGKSGKIYVDGIKSILTEKKKRLIKCLQ